MNLSKGFPNAANTFSLELLIVCDIRAISAGQRWLELYEINKLKGLWLQGVLDIWDLKGH